ncbi:MAG: OmpP1/FadL family transporter, partial [Candidatus Zixiibacteriota bacterium]
MTRRFYSGVIGSALFVLALGFAPPAAHAGGYSHDIGIRAQGLGGAFRAIADDWSAVAYNPAGLAYIADNHIGFSNGFHHNRFTYTPDFSLSGSSGIVPPDAGYLNGQEVSNRHEIGWTPEAALIVRVPVWGESVLGLSVHQTFDQDLDWTLFEGVQGYSTFDFSSLAPQFSIDMDIVNFQATFAREFAEDKFSIGLGVAVVRADLIHRSITLRDNPLPGVVRPFENIPEYTTANGNGWGIGGQLGVLWKPTEKLRVGATFTPKTTITASGDATLDFYLPSDSALRLSEGYLPGSDEFLLTTGFELKTTTEFETEVVAPASFGLGVAYDLSEKVTVSLDGVYTLWSQYEGFAFMYNTDTNLGYFKYENLTTTDPLELLNPMAKTNLTFPAE